MNKKSWREDLFAGSELEVLELVCERLKFEVIEEILEGGSAARVWLANDSAGDRFAVKIVVATPGVVDGHDIDSFRLKVTQIDSIRTKAPKLGETYLPILYNVEGENWACQITPYFESTDQAAPLRQPGGEDVFFRNYARFVDDLLVKGYGVETAAPPPDYLERIVIGRFLRRIPMLESAFPEALAADNMVINGHFCIAPKILLPHLLRQTAHPDMSPVRLGLCAHGDANTRNVLCGIETEFRLIDPRGSTEFWDPVYDLAKSLFCLTVWDPALRLGFNICSSARGETPDYAVSFQRPLYAGYKRAIEEFLPFLAQQAGVQEMMQGDACWKSRLLLTHDLHVLAEAPCRLSDRKPKFGADGALSTPEDLALGFYLLGTLFINELARQLESGDELDAVRHLSFIGL